MTVWPEHPSQDTVLVSGTHDVTATAGRTPLTTEQHHKAFASWNGFGVFFEPVFYGSYGVSLDYSGDATYQATHWEDLREATPLGGKTIPRLDLTSGVTSNGTIPIVVTLDASAATGEVQLWCVPAADPDSLEGTEPQQKAQIASGTATLDCAADQPGEYIAAVVYGGDSTHTPGVNILRFDPTVSSTSKGISTTDPLAPGQQAGCAAGALAPNTEYECAFHSDPTVLGRFTTDAQGNGQGVFALPTNAPNGVHHLSLTNTATGTVTHGAQFVVVAGVPVQPAPVTVTFGTGVPGPQFPPDPDPFGSLENVFGS